MQLNNYNKIIDCYKLEDTLKLFIHKKPRFKQLVPITLMFLFCIFFFRKPNKSLLDVDVYNLLILFPVPCSLVSFSFLPPLLPLL